MHIKGISADRAEEMHRFVADAAAQVAEGGQAALDAIDRRNRQTVPQEWQAVAERQDEVSIASFVDVLWTQMCLPDGLEFERVDDPATGTVQMHCTYCPWHAIAEAAGATQVGYALFCATDPFMIEGFNRALGPGGRRIRFSRTATLMQGDGYCNHRYEYDDGDA